MYGFGAMWALTQQQELLAAARKACDWFLAHLPPSSVPPWDFGDTSPNAPRDSSAGAAAASALLGLAASDPDAGRRARYLAAGARLLRALAAPPYLSTHPGEPNLLREGTGNLPSGDHSTGLIFGDYYFLEAANRCAALPQCMKL